MDAREPETRFLIGILRIKAKVLPAMLTRLIAVRKSCLHVKHCSLSFVQRFAGSRTATVTIEGAAIQSCSIKRTPSRSIMETRASLQPLRLSGAISIVLVVLYAMPRLAGVWALVCGTLFLAFAAWIVSKLWKPLPKSYWWFWALATCLGGIGLLIIKSVSG
jgi:hypothetical protein